MPTTIPGIPHESQALFERLHDAALASPADLRSELQTHMARIGLASAVNEMLDNTLAASIARCCEGLLDMLDEDTDEATHRLVQAAVRYFVIEEDIEPDRETLWGLDDDAVVCGAVASHLGREELLDGL